MVPLYKFHLRSGMNIEPSRHSTYKASLRMQPFMVILENSDAWLLKYWSGEMGQTENSPATHPHACIYYNVMTTIKKNQYGFHSKQ